jgi:uncharacterized protein YbjT (DUF2867 family)
MILVTGGTGFVGRHLVARLVREGKKVRILARRGAEVPGAEVVQGDVRDLSTVVSAARGCRAVIHLIGIIRERRGASLRRVHVGGTQTVVRACQEARVPRLLFMSALGARPRARSRYHRTKWQAEEVVRKAELAPTIFRPSVIFGAGNRFLPQLRDLVCRFPLIPIIGDGTSLLQPVWIEDVVSCFVGALAKPDAVGRTYELGGPETFGFEQLLDLLAEADGIEKPKVHLPAALVRPAVSALGRLLPNFPLTPDQLTMLLEDNVCDITEMRETFGLEPASLRDHLAD